MNNGRDRTWPNPAPSHRGAGSPPGVQREERGVPSAFPVGKGGGATGAEGKPLPGRQRGLRSVLKSHEETTSNLKTSFCRATARERSWGEQPPVTPHCCRRPPLRARPHGKERGCPSVCPPSLHTPRHCLAWPEAEAGSAPSPGASRLPPSPGTWGSPPRKAPKRRESPALGHPLHGPGQPLPKAAQPPAGWGCRKSAVG